PRVRLRRMEGLHAAPDQYRELVREPPARAGDYVRLTSGYAVTLHPRQERPRRLEGHEDSTKNVLGTHAGSGPKRRGDKPVARLNERVTPQKQPSCVLRACAVT